MAQFQQTLLISHPEADSPPELHGPPAPRRHAGQIRRAFESHLVLDHLNLAEALAARFQARGRDREDLNQVAYLGLVKAAQGFDAGRGTSFAAYAAPTITGELKRHLRDRCWMIRPPRRIQDLRTEVLRSEQALTQALGHPPTAGELAIELDVPASEVREAMAAAASMRPESLDAVETDTFEPRRHESPFAHAAALQDNPLDRLEELICLNQAIHVLSSEDQELLYRRYFCEESQAELGRRFGVSQMQISRRLSRVLVRLQELLQDGAAAADCTQPSPGARTAARTSAEPKRTSGPNRT
ncbi:sigma-70 family RNA polymerase sigma factor [Arthrobacter sp. ISL-72]|uniref:sigma-70 family RNA polymerase sigma factor n=1 Tax=Arthrobacter sp. ISL-72 TaxID=2819114 RepID=UPI001BEA0713|nr:sigma-70 family RNA polymerase sigma factor [Arthrobacter sp. ISL-72]MBT2594123.1 sigma-70 family RNA polymerase sigma factor [Arthrobacter sp. ISL-72]